MSEKKELEATIPPLDQLATFLGQVIQTLITGLEGTDLKLNLKVDLLSGETKIVTIKLDGDVIVTKKK